MPKDPTPRRKARLGSVLAHRQPDLTLVLANIHDPHNVSAIYRSCDAFGVDKVHLYYTDTPFPVLGRKTSASARKWVESVRHRDRQELETSLRARNMQRAVKNRVPAAHLGLHPSHGHHHGQRTQRRQRGTHQHGRR